MILPPIVTYYNINVQMSGAYKASPHFISAIAVAVGAKKTDVDEINKYNGSILFKSERKVSDVLDDVYKAIKIFGKKIHYIEVVYRYEWEMTPDKVVVWSNGDKKNYTGVIIFKEDM